MPVLLLERYRTVHTHPAGEWQKPLLRRHFTVLYDFPCGGRCGRAPCKFYVPCSLAYQLCWLVVACRCSIRFSCSRIEASLLSPSPTTLSRGQHDRYSARSSTQFSILAWDSVLQAACMSRPLLPKVKPSCIYRELHKGDKAKYHPSGAE